MARTTQKRLESLVGIAAELTGADLRLYGAYGGWDVHEVVNDAGGVRSLMGACAPAREADRFLTGMIAAVRLLPGSATPPPS